MFKHLFVAIPLLFDAKLFGRPRISRSSIPDPLTSWVPWVLDQQVDLRCSHYFDNGDTRSCQWLRCARSSRQFEGGGLPNPAGVCRYLIGLFEMNDIGRRMYGRWNALPVISRWRTLDSSPLGTLK